jgi:hypothetical protein
MWKILDEKELELKLKNSLKKFTLQRKKAVFSWIAMGTFFSIVITVATTFPSKISRDIKTIDLSLSMSTFFEFFIVINLLFVSYWFYNYRKFSRLDENDKMKECKLNLMKSENKVCVKCNKTFSNPIETCDTCKRKLIGATRCEWIDDH